MSIETPKGILGFDLDGTLTPRNQFEIHPQQLSNLLSDITDYGYYSIPITGKPASYAINVLLQNNLPDRGVIAENAGVYKRPGLKQIEVYGQSLKEMHELRDQIGIGMQKVDVTNIIFDEKEYEVVIDPGDISILTIFTDPSFVAHRWTFHKTIDAQTVVEKIQKIITTNQWENNIVVLPPFPDGAVQVIRKNPKTGHPIDKSSLIDALSVIYPHLTRTSIAMFGDGHNDIAAMKPEGVIPLTFANAHKAVKEFVPTKKGYISSYNAPEDNGVADGLLWLAKQGFFGIDTNRISNLILQIFPELE